MTQVILITGCSSGIGYVCAKKLHEDGHIVYATARKEEDVQRLLSEGFKSFKLDVTNKEDIKNAATLLEQRHQKLDILFNNAGFGQPGALEDLSVEALKEQFDTNLFGNFALTKEVLRLLRKSANAKIVQNSSILGFITFPYRGAYNASKFAIEGLSDTLRQELRTFGIKVCLIEPGPIRSAFRKNAYEKFKSNVNIQNSHYADDYKKAIRRFESNTDDPFTLGEEAVYQVLAKIIEAKNPKARYRVTIPTKVLWFLKRVLSTKMLDKVLQSV